MKNVYTKPDVFVIELRAEERVAAKTCITTPSSYWLEGPDTKFAPCVIFSTQGDNPDPCKFIPISSYDNPEEAPNFS